MKTIEFLGKKHVVEGTVGAPADAIFLGTLTSAKLVELRNLLVSNLGLGRQIKMFQNKSKGIARVVDLLCKYDAEFNDDLPDEMQPAKPAVKVRTGTKQTALIDLLKRPEGASTKEICALLKWKSNMAHVAISWDLKKRLGLTVTKSRVEDRGQVYRIAS